MGAVTPSLYLGEPEYITAVRVFTTLDGVDLIKAGGTVWVPDWCPEMAKSILLRLGVDGDTADKQVRAALDGLDQAFD